MYAVVAKEYCQDEKTYQSYGIQYADRVIDDITLDKGALERLVELCNRLELSVCHIDDVIEDFLFEMTCV